MKLQTRIIVPIIVFYLFLINGLGGEIQAQELNCNVQINTAQLSKDNVPLTPNDKKFFENLQKSLYTLINERKWSSLNVGRDEKIECSMILTIISRNLQTNTIEGSLAIQARRPVFNSSYNTSTLNFIEPKFVFQYAEFDPVEFYDNNVTSTLTATFAFYSYLILGIHFDSFGNNGGKLFFDKAQNIVNLAQSLPEKAWKATEKNQLNRYWISEAFTNGNYKVIHDIIYQYNRLGLDQMYENPSEARVNIFKALELVKDLVQLKSTIPSKQLFMESKVDEIINIFSPVSKEEKQKIMTLLLEIDPSNMPKYQKIMTPSSTLR